MFWRAGAGALAVSHFLGGPRAGTSVLGGGTCLPRFEVLQYLYTVVCEFLPDMSDRRFISCS